MDNGYITLNNGVKMPQLGFGTIGISNFPVEKIREVLDVCDIKPAVMQAKCNFEKND